MRKLAAAVNASVVEMGNRLRMIVNLVDTVPTDEPLPQTPRRPCAVDSATRPEDIRCCLDLACGAHHTGFSFDLTAEHLENFAEMAGIEPLLIDKATTIAGIKKELRWNRCLYYHLAKGL